MHQLVFKLGEWGMHPLTVGNPDKLACAPRRPRSDLSCLVNLTDADIADALSAAAVWATIASGRSSGDGCPRPGRMGRLSNGRSGSMAEVVQYWLCRWPDGRIHTFSGTRERQAVNAQG